MTLFNGVSYDTVTWTAILQTEEDGAGRLYTIVSDRGAIKVPPRNFFEMLE